MGSGGPCGRWLGEGLAEELVGGLLGVRVGGGAQGLADQAIELASIGCQVRLQELVGGGSQARGYGGAPGLEILALRVDVVLARSEAQLGQRLQRRVGAESLLDGD